MTDLALNFAMRAYGLAREHRDEEALRLIDAALAVDPALNGARFLKGVIALAHGDYETGWPLYEYRETMINASSLGIARYKGNQWRGAPTNRRLLLWAEQGYGDNLMMARYVRFVRALCPNVILEVHQPLVRLFQAIGAAPVVMTPEERKAKGISFDLQCSIMSLPYLFRDTPMTIPPQPYIKLPVTPRHKPQGYGLFWWSKNPGGADPLAKSIPALDVKAHLADEFDFISLQPEDSGCRDFFETALLMQELELIITIDSAVAHLAGAMGLPVWVLLPKYCDWRWERGRSDSCWYPSMRLFRQREQGKWRSVLEEVSAQLRGRKCVAA